jgi:hypothetical protein
MKERLTGKSCQSVLTASVTELLMDSYEIMNCVLLHRELKYGAVRVRNPYLHRIL